MIGHVKRTWNPGPACPPPDLSRYKGLKGWWKTYKDGLRLNKVAAEKALAIRTVLSRIICKITSIISKSTQIDLLILWSKNCIARLGQDKWWMNLHRFQCTISRKSEMNPIPGRMSWLTSAFSHLAQMGMLAIPQGQILESGCGTSNCSSKIGGVSGFGSCGPGICGGSSCILGGGVSPCEPPCCCPASGCFTQLVSRIPEKCQSLQFPDRYLTHLEIEWAE